MSLHRFHVPGVSSSGTVELPEAAQAHVTRVLRLTEGSAIRVFDAGKEFDAAISRIEKRRILIEVGVSVTALPERAVALRLIMSPLKGDLTELVIQKATELGVARISPVIFERTDTVARRDPSENRLERWRRVTVGASEQSGRAVVPQLDAVASLNEIVEGLGSMKKEDERRIVATEPSIANATTATATVHEVVSCVVAVGPAGGLSPNDLSMLSAAGFVAERFAPHTLRSETACIAALAILGERFK